MNTGVLRRTDTEMGIARDFSATTKARVMISGRLDGIADVDLEIASASVHSAVQRQDGVSEAGADVR